MCQVKSPCPSLRWDLLGSGDCYGHGRATVTFFLLDRTLCTIRDSREECADVLVRVVNIGGAVHFVQSLCVHVVLGQTFLPLPSFT